MRRIHWRKIPALLRLAWLGALIAIAFGKGCACAHREQIKTAMLEPKCLDAGGEPVSGEARRGEPRLEVHGHIPVLHLYGTGEEMAEQYGRLLRPAIQGLVGYAEALLPEGTMRRYVAYGRAAERHLPEDLRAELRIAAEAADVPHEYLLALNLVPRAACSTLAMWGEATPDGEMLMGRNADYFDMGLGDRGSLLIVFHATDRRPVVAVGFVGMLGAFTGVNADGVAFGNMLVFNTDNAAPPGIAAGTKGLPIQLAMRRAAARSASAAEMADALRTMPHAIPMNVMVADPREALVLELDPLGHTVRRGERGVLASTNYFVENPAMRSAARCERLYRLTRDAGERRGTMSVEQMQQSLHAVRIEKWGMIHNVHSVVFEPGVMRMHVSLNRIPATKGPWKTYDLRALLAE